MLCPRREGISGVFKLPDEDEWRERDGKKTCSFCGSLEPDDFMKRAAAGEKLGPTDKSYKVYVGERDKFYFQHLSEDQRREFVALHNARTLQLDYPGHFYVLPFFMTRLK